MIALLEYVYDGISDGDGVFAAELAGPAQHQIVRHDHGSVHLRQCSAEPGPVRVHRRLMLHIQPTLRHYNCFCIRLLAMCRAPWWRSPSIHQLDIAMKAEHDVGRTRLKRNHSHQAAAMRQELLGTFSA